MRGVPRAGTPERARCGRREPAGEPVPRLSRLLRRLHVQPAARVRPGLPKALSAVRLADYQRHAWPSRVPRAFRGWSGIVSGGLSSAALVLALAVAHVGWAGLISSDGQAASPYRLLPYPVLVTLMAAATGYSVVVMALAARGYWRSVALAPSGHDTVRAIARATWQAVTLRYLRGGGAECYYPQDDRPSAGRRRLHAMVAEASACAWYRPSPPPSSRTSPASRRLIPGCQSRCCPARSAGSAWLAGPVPAPPFPPYPVVGRPGRTRPRAGVTVPCAGRASRCVTFPRWVLRHVPSAREGLDHWSSGAQDRGRRPDGPIFDKPQIAGSVRPSKHGANMEQTW